MSLDPEAKKKTDPNLCFYLTLHLWSWGEKKKTCIKMEKEVSELFWLTDGMNEQAENPKQWAGSGRDIN